MNLTFRRELPTTAAAGQLILRLRPHHPDELALARAAWKEWAARSAGRPAPAQFMRGDGPITEAVLDAQPTFDALLAAAYLEQAALGHAPPASAESLAEYAHQLNRGVRPLGNALPPEQSLEALFEKLREDKGRDLENERNREHFVEAWKALRNALFQAMDEGHDPFDGKDGEYPFWTCVRKSPRLRIDFEILKNDVALFERDLRERAHVWSIRLPGAKEAAPGLFLDQPSSCLFKYWARNAGYRFLATYREGASQAGPQQMWFFSTDPRDRQPIGSLADHLRRRENPTTLEAAAHIWGTGKLENNSTIVVSGPHDFTRLPREAVLETVRTWGHVVDAPTPGIHRAVASRPTQNRGYATRAITLAISVLLLAGTWKLFHKEEIAPPHAFAAAPFQRQFEAWDNTSLPSVQFQREAEGVWACRLESPRDTKRLSAWLKSTAGTKPTDAVGVEAPGGFHAALGQPAGDWMEDPADKQWKSRSAFPINLEAGDRVVVRAPDSLGQHLWLECKPTIQMHMHIMAVGISKYGKPGFPNLSYAASGADRLMMKLRDSALSIYSQVEVYGRPDPETGREMALCDSYADSRAIKNLVDRFARAVRRDCEKVPTLAVVIFVGHGTAHAESEFKYIASDYNEGDPNTRVLGSDIEAPLRGLKCPRLLIFDCCQSGLIAQSMSLSTDQANRDLAATASAFARAVPSRFVLTSCQANQLAWEHPDWQAGLMTRSILDVLDDPEACRANGILNLAVLKSKVKEVMDRRAAEKNLTQAAVVDFPDSASEAIPLRYTGRRSQ